MQLTVSWFQHDSCLQQSLLSMENLSTYDVGGMKCWDCTSRLVCSKTLSHCVHLRSWSLANTTGLVWHQGNLRAALYCYFTSPYTVFVLNDVLCDLVVFAEMMKATAWCAVLWLLSSPGDEILLFTGVSQKAAAALAFGAPDLLRNFKNKIQGKWTCFCPAMHTI